MPERIDRFLQAKSMNIFVTESDGAKVGMIIGIILGVLLLCAVLFYLLARYMRRNVRLEGLDRSIEVQSHTMVEESNEESK